MDFSLLRNDLLTKGAILGCVMLAFNIAETSMFYYGGMQWMLPLFLEMLASMAIYAFLIYRFTRSYSNLILAAREKLPFFSYGEGLLYAMNVSGLAGIIVALGGYLYMHYVVGYDNFIDSYIKLFESFFSQVPLQAREADMVRELLGEMQKAEEPSIFSNILSYVSRYIVTGALVGFVVAAITKREPWKLNDLNNSNDNNENEPNNEQ